MSWIRENFTGARITGELFSLLQNPAAREQLRAVLIQTYFVAEIRPALWEQGMVNVASYEYEKVLLTGIKEQAALFEETPEEKKKKIRDQGFRNRGRVGPRQQIENSAFHLKNARHFRAISPISPRKTSL